LWAGYPELYRNITKLQRILYIITCIFTEGECYCERVTDWPKGSTSFISSALGLSVA
jgi:hypothetical protein